MKNIKKHMEESLKWEYPSAKGEFGLKELTEKINEYLMLVNNADILNAEMSARACRLHEELMAAISDSWSHEDQDYREGFANLLEKIKPLMKRGGKFYVFGNDDYKMWFAIPKYIINKEDPIDTDRCGIMSGNSFLPVLQQKFSDYVGYFAGESGIIYGTHEYHDGTRFWSTGHYYCPADTKINPTAAQEIRAMGLIPVILECGSYHENWFHLYGIYPEKWDQFKKDHEEYITEDGYHIDE